MLPNELRQYSRNEVLTDSVKGINLRMQQGSNDLTVSEMQDQLS